MNNEKGIKYLIGYLVFAEKGILYGSPILALCMIVGIIWQSFTEKHEMMVIIALIVFLGIVFGLTVSFRSLIFFKKVEIVNYCFNNESLNNNQRSIFKMALTQLRKDNDWLPINDYYSEVISILLTDNNEICDELFYNHFDDIVKAVKGKTIKLEDLKKDYSKYKTPEKMKEYSNSLSKKEKVINKKYFYFAYKFSLFAAMFVAFIISIVENIPGVDFESTKLLRGYVFDGSAIGLLGAELVFNFKDFFIAEGLKELYH